MVIGAIGTAVTVLGLQPAAAAVSPKPQRIMTMNMCADLMVLQLVPKSRIASVTYLAKAGSDVLFPGAEAGIAINHGTPEDIINLKPDLIVAGDFSTPMTRRMAKKVGARLVELKSATSWSSLRTCTPRHLFLGACGAPRSSPRPRTTPPSSEKSWQRSGSLRNSLICASLASASQLARTSARAS